MVNPFNLMPFGLKRILSKIMFVGVASGTAVLAGLVPTLQPTVSHSSATLVFNNAAYAQSPPAITSAEIQNYVRSVLQIEPMRQTAYDEIKQILGQVPSIECHRPESLANLDRRIQRIATDYCSRSIQIVESNNLTITRFNTITVIRQRDVNIGSQIQDFLLRLQQLEP
jgi:Domain of unknown function (DUF4168)